MKLKHTLCALACAAAIGLASCGSGMNIAESSAVNNGELSIVCTTFSCYDWTRELLGDRVDDVQLTYLLDSGADLHSYQPSAADMVKISGCDVFIYVGGESEHWAEDALKEASNKNMKALKLLDADGISAKEEEVKEGMQADDDEDEGGEPEFDEHVWLSVKNAQVLCRDISETLSEADPEHSDEYRANCEAYEDKLSELDERFSEAAKGDITLIFGDRFPFRYLCDDYGIDYYAAFAGCSAETEASFETVAFLAKKADEVGTDTIYTIENSDGKIAQAIISNTKNKDQKTVVMNSLQSVDGEQIKNGATYLKLMEENLGALG